MLPPYPQRFYSKIHRRCQETWLVLKPLTDAVPTCTKQLSCTVAVTQFKVLQQNQHKLIFLAHNLLNRRDIPLHLSNLTRILFLTVARQVLYGSPGSMCCSGGLRVFEYSKEVMLVQAIWWLTKLLGLPDRWQTERTYWTTTQAPDRQHGMDTSFIVVLRIPHNFKFT